MWNNLASPPENFRYYKFSENSNEQLKPVKDINLEENKTTLFQPKIKDKNFLKVREESQLLQSSAQAVSVNTTQKALSSLKSTAKANNKNHESAYDLKMKSRQQEQNRQKSKSML